MNWEKLSQATLSPADIRQPWRSVYGFASSAARLAAYQPLTLHCREDEVFALMAALNELLAHPETLDRSLNLLHQCRKEKLKKLARLVGFEETLIAAREAEVIIRSLEKLLATSEAPHLVQRLTRLLRPNSSAEEVAGLLKRLGDQQRLLSALEQVKEIGFRAIVTGRGRQPARPALEARRTEPILVSGQASPFMAGMLFPAKDHLTLWRYLVIRAEGGQSTVWN